ncbi:Esterase EstD [Polaribacter huanghezhanensis]|uniref:alpha/beta fold hydrolase n=1 Tax=Polaribacter huanghezhanensis TaxID=1354726 RepID=UPI002647AA5A|nr:alpha/beta hydrolase [Polaribacter huanghezhanensis]WKD84738.1 Esterase EstD [Polaribacter huanghezhanensis]
MKTKSLYLFLLIFSVSHGQSKITSEEILIQNDSIELPGTLTFTNTKTPLVIWVHGSGNVDRNGNQSAIVKANYIKQFRDEINKNNIAFFSFDKRTSNPKNFKFLKGIVFTDFEEDVEKVITHFKDDKRFSEIILVGHSQGSLIAMLASKNATKYISISGPGESIDKTMVKQITAQNALLGESAAAHFKELKETGSIKNINPFLFSIFSKANLPFLKSWANYNPTEEIKKLTIPVLIINGTKDLQVKVEDATALHHAKPSSELVLIKNMNHVLKNIEKDADNMKSYYTADFPISKKLITTIVAFIKK